MKHGRQTSKYCEEYLREVAAEEVILQHKYLKDKDEALEEAESHLRKIQLLIAGAVHDKKLTKEDKSYIYYILRKKHKWWRGKVKKPELFPEI